MTNKYVDGFEQQLVENIVYNRRDQIRGLESSGVVIEHLDRLLKMDMDRLKFEYNNLRHYPDRIMRYSPVVKFYHEPLEKEGKLKELIEIIINARVTAKLLMADIEVDADIPSFIPDYLVGDVETKIQINEWLREGIKEKEVRNRLWKRFHDQIEIEWETDKNDTP